MPERAQQPALTPAPAPARASTARPRRQRSREPLPEGVLGYKILPGKGETNPMRRWARERLQNLLPLGVLMLIVAMLAACGWVGWLMAQWLGPLGYDWFIPWPAGQYSHLQTQGGGTHFFLAVPLAIWCLVMLVQALGSANEAHARFKKLHRRKPQVRRAPKAPRPVPGEWPRPAVVAFTTVLFALLAWPMLRDYDIVTIDAIVHQGPLASSPRVYPLKALQCVHLANPRKGGPSWQLAFGPHGRIDVHGIDPAVLTRLLSRQHLSLSPTRCP
jgi:hypothetical protein